MAIATSSTVFMNAIRAVTIVSVFCIVFYIGIGHTDSVGRFVGVRRLVCTASAGKMVILRIYGSCPCCSLCLVVRWVDVV